MNKFRFFIEVSAKSKNVAEIRKNIELALRVTHKKPDRELEDWKPLPITLDKLEPTTDSIVGVQSGELFSKDEVSIQEKDMLCYLAKDFPTMRARLDFKLVKLGPGTEYVYEIPSDLKENILNLVCPLAMNFAPGTEYRDIHEDKIVKAEDLMVIRTHDINIIVSPYYLESGGTLVDLVDPISDGEAGYSRNLRPVVNPE